MKPAAKVLLEKLLRTRPKPDEGAIRELFMAIKATPIQDLMALIGGGRGNDTPPLATAELEAEVKRQLRKVGGKASDYVPYLMDAVKAGAPSGQKLPSLKGLTLGKALSAAHACLGAAAQEAVNAALRAYVAENAVSYQLKSA